MYVAMPRRALLTVRLPIACFALFFAQISRATNGTDINLNVSLSQTGIDFVNLSPMNVAILIALGIVALLVLAWVIRRSVRRNRLSSLRAQRYGTSGSDGSMSGGKLFARSRPEKTEVIRTIVIGSEGDVDVRFSDEGVSSRHAELLVLRPVDASPLMPLEPIYFIRDMASTRGIEVMRGDDWMQFQADVVLDDELLRIGEIEITAAELNRLAIESRLDATEAKVPH